MIMSPRKSVSSASDPCGARQGIRPSLSVGFILLPRFTLSAFSSFIDVLRLAADEGDRSRPIRCTWDVLAPNLAQVTASCGLQVSPWTTFEVDPRRYDYLVVIGGLLADDQTYDRSTIDFIKLAEERGVTLVGVCTGSFALAEAGLLTGRKCCVSWYHYRDLIDRYGEVIPVADKLFVQDGRLITCAGGLAALDLSASIVQRHLGNAHAQKALHILVADTARRAEDAQPQPPGSSLSGDPRVRRAMLMIEQSLSHPPRVDSIARAVGLSKRQLERIFVRELGRTIQEFSRDLRIYYGLWLLANSAKTITAVAIESGFSDISHFNRVFHATFGTSPSRLRAEGVDVMRRLIEQSQLKQVEGRSGAASFSEAPSGRLVIDPGFLTHERRPYFS
jgi:transcriptional regulator GlxA family with amidase domain